MNILRQQAITISVSQCVIEHFACLLAAAESHNTSISQNRHMRKAVSGRPKSSSLGITHNVLAAQKFAFDRLHGAHEAGIVGFQEADLGQQQNAGVEIIDPECQP